ncbi:MAG: hypothetical protein J0G95_10990 [Rhizobiales bacterium]|nr:hypothetical protein [Hyphomicrobiales bacterium]
MTTTAKHTAGPWETDNSWSLHGEARPDMMDYRCHVDAPVPFTENEHGGFERIETQTGAIAFGRTPEEAQANSSLIAEAFNVAHETSLTPRQLAERCARLEAAAKVLLAVIADARADENVDCMTDAGGYICGDIMSEAIEGMRAAIAKAEGGA